MKKIFIIGYVWPEPTASAAGVRMLQLIRFFREAYWEVHFGTPAQCTENAYDLRGMGVTLHGIHVNDDNFNDLIREVAPQAVLFDRFMMEEQFGWRVAEHCPDAIRILDTEDLHFLRKRRQAAVRKGDEADRSALLEDPVARREVASIYRSDLSLIISEAEMELLESVFGVSSSLLVYHPIFAEDGLLKMRERLPGFHSRRDMMFIGNFLHEPNIDAVRVMIEWLWPEIKKQLPEARLHIYGAYMPDHVKTKKALEMGVEFHGRASEVNTVMQEARIILVPLRFGAGLKGKLIRAMENGLPSVTTPVGAEGIAGNLEWGGVVGPLDSSFATAAINLYKEAEAWGRAVESGFNIVDRRFQREKFENVLLQRINALGIALEDHRARNFTGQMLMDQRNMAARYLSKYIMAKNRNN